MTGILICIWRNMKGALTMTNAEKLNKMTNAELLYFIQTNDRCDCCTYSKTTDFCLNRCELGISLWLFEECKGELI